MLSLSLLATQLARFGAALGNPWLSWPPTDITQRDIFSSFHLLE